MQGSDTMTKPFLLVGLFIYGLLMGGLIVAGSLRLVTWPAILLVFRLTLVVFLLGLAGGMLSKCFLGRKKSAVSNLLGIMLIVPVFLGMIFTVTFFYDEPQVGNLRKAIGLTASSFCWATAAEIGRNITSHVQRLRQ